MIAVVYRAMEEPPPIVLLVSQANICQEEDAFLVAPVVQPASQLQQIASVAQQEQQHISIIIIASRIALLIIMKEPLMTLANYVIQLV